MEIRNFLKKITKSPWPSGVELGIRGWKGEERRKTKEAEEEGKPTRIVVKGRRRTRMERRKIEVAAKGRIVGVATVHEGAIPSPGDSMGGDSSTLRSERGDPSAMRSERGDPSALRSDS